MRVRVAINVLKKKVNQKEVNEKRNNLFLLTSLSTYCVSYNVVMRHFLRIQLFYLNERKSSPQAKFFFEMFKRALKE